MKENSSIGLSQDEICKWLKFNLAQLKQSFAGALKLALSQYHQMQTENRKEALAFVYVSYLRSSILTGRPWFQLDLYDHKQWIDLEECATPWDTGKVTSRIYTDIAMPRNSEIGDGQYAIIEQAWLKEAEKYFHCLHLLLPAIVAAAQVMVTDSVQFYFGEYMDVSEQITR